jgi:hypothetical protein
MAVEEEAANIQWLQRQDRSDGYGQAETGDSP